MASIRTCVLSLSFHCFFDRGQRTKLEQEGQEGLKLGATWWEWEICIPRHRCLPVSAMVERVNVLVPCDPWPFSIVTMEDLQSRCNTLNLGL